MSVFRRKFSAHAEQPDRLLGRLSLLLAATLPLTAIGLNHFLEQEKESPRAVATLPPIAGKDDRLIQFCASNVQESRSFVLFQHGTCIVVQDLTEIDEIKSFALETLARTAVPGAKFVCAPVEDENIIVSYSEPVFHLRFGEDIRAHREAIETDFMRFLSEEERATTPLGWDPPFHAKIGLRSRARLLKDAQQPVICQIIAPSSTEKSRTGETASVSF